MNLVPLQTEAACFQLKINLRGIGESNVQKKYDFVDEKVGQLQNYYRLKAVNYNGLRQDLGILSIDNSTNSKVLLRRINTFGQEVDETYKGLVIEQYNDGTIVKTIQ